MRKSLFDDKTIGGLLLLTGTINAILAFFVTVRDCYGGPGVDLRSRVVAARAMRLGLDPYTYEWSQVMPDRLLDPGRRSPGPSRTTYPPTLWMLYAPLSGLPYREQRVIWFVLEWSALVGSLVLLVGMAGTRFAQTALLALGLVFFASGDLWRFHVERGQFYVFVLLLLCLGTRSLVRRGGTSWRAGVFFGLAAALRPTFLLAAVPLALLGYRKAAVAMMASLGVATALTLPWVGLRGWTSYVATMRVWETMAAAEDGGRAFLLRTYGTAKAVPTSAEGVDFSKYLSIETWGSTVIFNFHPVYFRLSRLVRLPGLHTIARIGFAIFSIVVLGYAIKLHWRGTSFSPRFVVAFASLASINGEYFLPLRYSYADILFLHPLAMLIPALLRFERLLLARTLVIAGLLISRSRILLGGFVDPLEFGFLTCGLTLALLQVAAVHRVRGMGPRRAGDEMGSAG